MTGAADLPGAPQDARTFPEFVRAAAAAYGDAVAVKFTGETIADEQITFAELDSQSAELARGLIARGVGKGSRVGFIYGNGPGFALMLATIARIGAVAIPISTMIRANELIRVLRQSDVSGLIVQRRFFNNDYVDRLCDALPALKTSGPLLRLPETPFLRWILSSGGDLPASMEDVSVLAEEAGSVGEDLLREIESEVSVTDQMVEIYTSGSMALPKGVRHNHGPILFRTHYLREIIGYQRGEERTVMMPMFWIGGMMMYLMPYWEIGATAVCGERSLNNSRIAMGSVLAGDELALMEASPKPWWGLGMSETIGPYSYGDVVRAPGRPMCAPMDHFADRYDIRIADENDRPVNDGEIGEMQVRGYPVTPGLHKIERDVHFTADGYYRTGDLCEVDGSRIHFVGRGGDMIKTAGSNVSPAEVELELQSLEGVHNAYVVGLPDKERGQLVVAALVPRDADARLDTAAIEAEMRKRLSSYKVPRAYVQIAREDVPMLHSNKISRRQVEVLIKTKLGRG